MPDWSYRTLLQPLLFALPPETARRFTLGVLNGLARMPGGASLIDVLGHMRADPRLSRMIGEQRYAGPVGLQALIDPEARASSAFARFGVGFIEVGPVSAGATIEPIWQRDVPARALVLENRPRVSVTQLRERLERAPVPAALWIRVPADEPAPAQVLSALQPWAAGFALEAGDPAQLAARVREATAATSRPVVVSIAADQPLDVSELSPTLAGVWVRGELAHTRAARVHGAPALSQVEARVRELRASLPAALLIAGGIDQPADIPPLAAAGAQLYAADTGLVFSGPGLIKRCNEALLHEAAAGARPALPPVSLSSARCAWFWAFWLGVAMLIGGALALAVAHTRVVLPYDEALCGLRRSQLQAVNPFLLPFMRHDRVTLAGTMLSIGVLYAALALHGIRRGAHWAQVTVIGSALAGFLSLFSFLGFGYFDPFHAFVSSVLFQCLLLCMVTKRSEPAPPRVAPWREDAAWRAGLWGQLLFVITGVGLIGAGVVITIIGCTDVFVREDLEFMRTTAAELLVAHERLVPLVAHDRASMGGMLIANGLTVLLCALWGFRAGEAWLWHAFAWAGALAFGSAIGVHFAVRYESLLHLAPAYAGLGTWLLALILTRAWLTTPAAPRA